MPVSLGGESFVQHGTELDPGAPRSAAAGDAVIKSPYAGLALLSVTERLVQQAREPHTRLHVGLGPTSVLSSPYVNGVA